MAIGFNKNASCLTFVEQDKFANITESEDVAQLDITPKVQPPFSWFYSSKTRDNVSVSHWCGPLVQIVAHLASKMKLKINYPNHAFDFDDIIPVRVNGRIGDISLFARTSLHHQYMRHFLGFEYTKYLGYEDDSRILAFTIKKQFTWHYIFRCFEVGVYLATILSAVLLSSAICLTDKYHKPFVLILWSFLSILLSDNFAVKHLIRNKLLVGLWLIACTILLKAFSDQLWNLLVRREPIDAIDSWDDLFGGNQWKRLTIQTIDFTDMDVFAQSSDSPMAKHFKQRIQLLENKNLFVEPNQSLINVLNDQVIEGKAVQAFNYHVLQKWKKYYIDRGFVEDLDFHISKSGHSTVYFAQIHQTVPEQYVKALNDVISSFIESGIYEKDLSKVRELEAKYMQKESSEEFQCRDIKVSHLKGVLILDAIVTNLCFIALLIECLVFKAKIK